jgi:hypothetical protein
MNLETPEGFEAAKQWTANFISCLNEGGVWGVPRSNSGYQIWNETKKYACVAGGEECIERVLEALGYESVNGKTLEIEGAPV